MLNPLQGQITVPHQEAKGNTTLPPPHWFLGFYSLNLCCKNCPLTYQEEGATVLLPQILSPSGQSEGQFYWWYRGLPSGEKAEANTGRN